MLPLLCLNSVFFISSTCIKRSLKQDHGNKTKNNFSSNFYTLSQINVNSISSEILFIEWSTMAERGYVYRFFYNTLIYAICVKVVNLY